MLQINSIIQCLIYDSGYKTIQQFAKANKIKSNIIEQSMCKNVWSDKTLKKLSTIFGVNLMEYKTGE